MVRSSDGQVIQVFKKSDWMQPKKQQPSTGVPDEHFAIEVTLKNGRKMYVDSGSGTDYPMDAMAEIRKSGVGEIAANQIKQVVSLPPKKAEQKQTR